MRRLLGKYRPCALEVQDQTKNGLWDDRCKGFPTTNGQSLVFGLPGCVLAVILEIRLPSYMASLREKMLKPLNFKWGRHVKSQDQLKRAKGIRRSPKMCQDTSQSYRDYGKLTMIRIPINPAGYDTWGIIPGRTCKWLITVVSCCFLGLWDPFHSWPNFMAEINGGDPITYVSPGMIQPK